MRFKTPPPIDSYRVSREGWPAGPWDAEREDRVEWRQHGLACLIVRNDMGAWCGYVGVGPEHPWYERPCDAVGARVARPINYSNHCVGAICHSPRPGDPDEVWWIGFDCMHGSDLYPGLARLMGLAAFRRHALTATYRCQPWVATEVDLLALQARDAREDHLAKTPATAFYAVRRIQPQRVRQ